MAAIAPFFDLDVAEDLNAYSERSPDHEPADPAGVARQLEKQNLLLAASSGIPASVRFFLDDLAEDLAELPRHTATRVDPYLLVAVQSSLIAALRALEDPDERRARRELRVRLEQLRQVYRELADARPIYDGRPAAELVRWLTNVLDVPHARLAALFDVSPRTWQRWLSDSDESEPGGEEARRVRIVASLVVHLRHALTGEGVLDWMQRPHSAISGKTPRELLAEPDALARLTRLAASTRGAIAA